MIHDLRVAPVGAARADGHRRSSGRSSPADADRLQAHGHGQTTSSGHLFTTDGERASGSRPSPTTSRHPRQPRPDLPEHGGLQRAAAERRRTPTGSSTTRPTGSSRCTSFRSPAASPERSRPDRSALRAASSPARGRRASRTTRCATATARSCRATRTSSTERTTRSASSATASSRAAWRNEIYLDVFERAGIVRAGT